MVSKVTCALGESRLAYWFVGNLVVVRVELRPRCAVFLG